MSAPYIYAACDYSVSPPRWTVWCMARSAADDAADAGLTALLLRLDAYDRVAMAGCRTGWGAPPDFHLPVRRYLGHPIPAWLRKYL